jgi:hypothetical protein
MTIYITAIIIIIIAPTVIVIAIMFGVCGTQVAAPVEVVERHHSLPACAHTHVQ